MTHIPSKDDIIPVALSQEKIIQDDLPSKCANETSVSNSMQLAADA